MEHVDTAFNIDIARWEERRPVKERRARHSNHLVGVGGAVEKTVLGPSGAAMETAVYVADGVTSR